MVSARAVSSGKGTPASAAAGAQESVVSAERVARQLRAEEEAETVRARARVCLRACFLCGSVCFGGERRGG